MFRMDSQKTHADKETDAPIPIEPRNPPRRRVKRIELQATNCLTTVIVVPFKHFHCEFVTFQLIS